MKVSGADAALPPLRTPKKNADLLRENFKRIQWPAGCKIDFYHL